MNSNSDIIVKDALLCKLQKLEKQLKSDVIFYYGAIDPSIEKRFRDFIENLKLENNSNKLSIILNTPGGSAETVEKLVNIIRHHYNEIDFIVPDSAMSAGTIFCMSGDKIWMDYSSSLGPIDPQVFNGSNWVPALGYLDKVDELIKKSKDSTLTQAEFLILKEQDLAMLNSYERARDLTVSLLKKWLVKYKFKDWNVELKEKKEKAKTIANILGDNKLWHSHGRSISITTLRDTVELKIADYSENKNLFKDIRDYNDNICDYISKRMQKGVIFLHSRNYF